jgi:uncharacterized damage-inducible protein DinB
MTAKDVIRLNLDQGRNRLNTLLDDLSDADLLVRPVPGANHIAWQLGHLIASETRMMKQVPGAAAPELPPGFAERHTKDTAASDTGFSTKAEYLALYDRVRAATLAALDRVSDADLDKPIEGPLASRIPHVAGLFLLAGNHATLHAGQFSAVRRKLGKPVKF